jgi:UDP-glucose 6-dehydrogenase
MKIKEKCMSIETRDYMTAEYIDLFESMNAELVKGTEEDLERFITSNPMQQLDTETNVTEHYTLRELYVIQLGTYAADEQHIIDVKDMSTGVDKLLKLFADKEIV